MPRTPKRALPAGTKVEVCDEGRWHRGGTIIGYTPETGDYMIQWAAWGNEITTANEVDVRGEGAPEKVHWSPVKHERPFSLTSKKAGYEDYIEANARPVEPRPRQQPADDDADIPKWEKPSSKPESMPEWHTTLKAAPKKTPKWEKNLQKHRKKAVISDRPAFGIKARKATIPQWQPEYIEAPQPLVHHQDKKYMRYWGRFAPDGLLEEEEEESQRRSVRKTRKRLSEHEAHHHDPEPEEEEPEVEEQPEPEPEEEQPEPEAEEPAPEEPVEEEKVEEEAEPEPQTAAELYAALGGTDEHHLECDYISDNVGAKFDHADDVVFAAAVKTALAVASPDATAVDAEKFETFHTALVRYLTLAALYEDMKLDDSIVEDQTLFERSVPVISKWGIEMIEITNVFADPEASQTLGWFCDWAVRQGLCPAEAAPEEEAPVKEESMVVPEADEEEEY